MLQEESQRKAYFQLLTCFIMQEKRPRSPNTNSRVSQKTTEKVKYMISHPATGKREASGPAIQLYRTLKLGMTESTVLNLSNKICIERGYVLMSDTCKRLYMHLHNNIQIWVEFAQPDLDSEPLVTAKSEIEPKSTWKIYHNNTIKITPKS